MSDLPRLGDWNAFEELSALQDKQLPHVLEWAGRSPFYSARYGAGKWPATRTDLARLPLTSKRDLRDGYPFGMLAAAMDQVATYHESSGTAGTPTPSFYTEADWIDLAQRYARKWVGISERDVFLVRTPYALMVTGHLAQAAARLCGATVIPGDNRSLAMPYSRVLRVLHDLGVTLTWSMPTETLLWAAAAEAEGYQPTADFPALRALFVGGEPLSQARRERISRVWGVPVVEEYGSTETGSLAGECRYGTLHLWADRAIFEVHDSQTGDIKTEGHGELVVTPLYRQAMPLLRYNLEDNVEVSYTDCPCGWNLPQVRVLGRAAFGYPVSSALITQNGLEELVFRLPERHGVLFWRAKALPERLYIEIEVDAPHQEAARAALREAVHSTYGVPCDVIGLPRGSLVPREVLTAVHDVVKPRSLFGPDEEWEKALLYY